MRQPGKGASVAGWSVFELRQYTLQPGKRDTLVELFDRALVEPQEATGMWIVGQFRDLDRPDRFVWVRGFRDMTVRTPMLTEFYRGPTWKEHASAANATMRDVSDVLLLRPASRGSGFQWPEGPRLPVAAAKPPGSVVTATVYHCGRPVDAGFVEFFLDRVQPVLAGAGATPLACLQTEPAENTFPSLPVRVGVQVLVWFSWFASPADLDAYTRRLDQVEQWRADVQPELLSRLSGPPEQLRLAPTPRSALR